MGRAGMLEEAEGSPSFIFESPPAINNYLRAVPVYIVADSSFTLYTRVGKSNSLSELQRVLDGNAQVKIYNPRT